MCKSISWSQVAVLVLQVAVAQSLPIIRPVLPRGQHCCPVERGILWKKDIRGLDSSASSMLAPLLNYRFLLPELQLRDAVGHHGNALRLRKFVSELISGIRPLRVGVLGGSISWGEEATVRGHTDWFSIFTDWLPRVSARNGCVPGTTSTYSLLCLEELVDQEVDLVLVEYGVNDVFADQLVHNTAVMGLERLLRRLMELPGWPAVVGVAVPRIKTSSFGAFHATSLARHNLGGRAGRHSSLPRIP
ncbi:hypothetical protein VOLCADRAFT_107840 [Volvox carteri f. nagariensis]|uniref:SGNH hydrolase-type esterase domain-containing protein n=1 Tax=Volvox carteri f. nagariensis TaxID=3068 RepID=D8UGS5_VOLCA|nr:uncharacterized protein VOLCADRAFT_107840 [Volvox carteri f. nagariensis]EFJ41077.1 hypothetical protein VOLCADRAFT_107840 [Volvox carteri f. nagariensis]|eukprot:XP_002957840.1 hypothetical protein VOLCADRAFT_107840 [Volvox carteri f. nagariensis]